MNRETLKALRGSIKKWEGVVAGTTADYGGDNCPLCALFFYKSACRGCPVYEDTKIDACRGSPFIDWFEATRSHGYPRYARDDESVMCAVLELEYLKSLLPSRRTK